MVVLSLSDQGFETTAEILANLGTDALIEAALANGEGKLAREGALVVETGKHTGRSARDKFIVRDAETESTVNWGKVNVPMTPGHFAALKAAAADPTYFDQGRACGTGPYKLKSYSAGKQIVLEQNTDYWGGWTDKQFKNVAIQITPEAIVQQQALQSGQVDAATSVPLENIRKLQAGGKVTVYRDASTLNYVGFYNTSRPPLSSSTVAAVLASTAG